MAAPPRKDLDELLPRDQAAAAAPPRPVSAERPGAVVAPTSRPTVRPEEAEVRREPRAVRGGGKKARAALTLLGLSATVGALVAIGAAATIYLIVLAIQSALS